MALDYNIYYSLDRNGSDLLEQAFGYLAWPFEKQVHHAVHRFYIPHAGIEVFSLETFQVNCRIKEKRFSYHKCFSVSQDKDFPDDARRRTELLKLVWTLIEQFDPDLVFLFNGEALILKHQHAGETEVCVHDEFFDHEVGDGLKGKKLVNLDFSPGDFQVT